MTPAQGEIWWAETEEQERRPVLVVTRSHAVPVLSAILVAPVTTRIRHVSTELPLGEEAGLPRPSVASFDNLQPIRRAFLTERVGEVAGARAKICRALVALADC